MSEHRKLPRWQINQQVKLKLEQAVEDVFCQIKDINYKGIGVVLAAKLPQDTAFRLNLRLADDYTFDAEVWVAWVKVIDGINHYGLYFIKLKDADKEKIYGFLNKYCTNEIKRKAWSEEIEFEKGGKDMDDHRIFERFPVDISARYLNPDTGKEGLAKIRNVSAKGLGLAVNEELGLHTALEIWLEMKDKGGPLYIRGAVVWEDSEGQNNYRLGVELEKADLMGISRVFRP
jgi:hypothetical protein